MIVGLLLEEPPTVYQVELAVRVVLAVVVLVQVLAREEGVGLVDLVAVAVAVLAAAVGPQTAEPQVVYLLAGAHLLKGLQLVGSHQVDPHLAVGLCQELP